MRAIKTIAEVDIGHKIDALRFSLLGVQTAFDEVSSLTNSIDNTNEGEIDFASAFKLLSICWGLIDSADRARWCAESIPFKRKSFPQKKDFITALVEVRDFRNMFHHWSARSKSLPKECAPYMGAVSWGTSLNSLTCCSVCISSGAVSPSFPSVVIDAVEHKFLSNPCFAVADRTISLLDVANSCKEFSQHFEEYLEHNDVLNEGFVKPMFIRVSYLFPPPHSQIIAVE
jgi:hypothetical protein